MHWSDTVCSKPSQYAENPARTALPLAVTRGHLSERYLESQYPALCNPCGRPTSRILELAEWESHRAQEQILPPAKSLLKWRIGERQVGFLYDRP